MIYLIIITLLVFVTLFKIDKDFLRNKIDKLIRLYREISSDNERDGLNSMIHRRINYAILSQDSNVNNLKKLYDEPFSEIIDKNIGLLIFAIMMSESQYCKKLFARNPKVYFAKIESEIFKVIKVYKPSSSNYEKAEILSILLVNGYEEKAHEPTY